MGRWSLSFLLDQRKSKVIVCISFLHRDVIMIKQIRMIRDLQDLFCPSKGWIIYRTDLVFLWTTTPRIL